MKVTAASAYTTACKIGAVFTAILALHQIAPVTASKYERSERETDELIIILRGSRGG